MITMQGFLLGCFIVTAIYHTLLFIFYKRNYAALYFALITYSSSLLTVIKEGEMLIRFKIILLIFVVVPIFYIEFTRHMYPNEFDNRVSKIFSKLVYAYAGLFSLLIIIIPMDKFIALMPIMQKVNFPINMLLIVYMFAQLIRASRAKRSDARTLLVGYGILFITAMIIYAVPNSMISKSNPIGALGILLLYSGALARRYAKAYHTCEMIVEERTEELKEKNLELIRLINEDVLTGAFSRRYIMDKLEKTFIESRNSNVHFSLISFDLDRFKQVNDQYGHPMGDRVLVETIKVLRTELDIKVDIGRMGGEEFIILLPGVEKENAILIAEEIRSLVKSINYEYMGNNFNITCSLGLVSSDEEVKDYDEMLTKVDNLLYEAKENGRDQLCY